MGRSACVGQRVYETGRAIFSAKLVADVPSPKPMSRNLYILAAVLLVLAIACFGMSWTPGSHQPGLPGEAIMWRTMALTLFLLGTLSCLGGTITNLFEQASRRHEERERRKNNRST